jgi:hypothetical protein
MNGSRGNAATADGFAVRCLSRIARFGVGKAAAFGYAVAVGVATNLVLIYVMPGMSGPPQPSQSAASAIVRTPVVTADIKSKPAPVESPGPEAAAPVAAVKPAAPPVPSQAAAPIPPPETASAVPVAPANPPALTAVAAPPPAGEPANPPLATSPSPPAAALPVPASAALAVVPRPDPADAPLHTNAPGPGSGGLY